MLTLKEKLFCRFYNTYQNPKEAAIKAGYGKHIAEKKAQKLLNKPEIKHEMQKTKSEVESNQLTQWACIALQRLIFSTPNDTLTLALKNEQLDEKQIEFLNLVQISEFKKLKDGSLEIKFIDKIKAISCLIEIANSIKNTNKTSEFLNALTTNPDNDNQPECENDAI